MDPTPTHTPPAAPRLATLVRRPAIALLLLVAAVVVAYAPALAGQFLWDDTPLVRTNQFIRSPVLGFEAFRHTLFGGESNFYRPTQTLTFIADYWVWELNPFGYHLTNILIHALNACLLYLILRGLLPRVLSAGPNPTPAQENAARWLPLGVALVWATHPVHSAAVAYVSGRADTLAMCFCTAAWLLCDRALAARRALPGCAWAGAALVSLLAGLCAKEIAGMWLAIYLGLLFTLRREVPRAKPWLVLGGGLFAVGVYLVLRHLPATPPTPPSPGVLPSKWLLMLRALGDYGGLMVFPKNLFMERQVFAAPGLANPADAAVYTGLAVAGALVLAGLVAGACWPGRGCLCRRIGGIWFLAAFLPVSNLFSLNATVAEHWLYLPSIGFILFLAGVLLDLPLSNRTPAWLAPALITILAVAFGVRTYWRCFDWRDELTFFRQTIADGGDVPRARDALATAFSHAHDDQAAIAVLRDFTRRYPQTLSTQVNLALALARAGQLEEARGILERTTANLLRTGKPPAFVAVLHALDRLETDPQWPNARRQLVVGALQHFPDAWQIVQLAAADAEKEHDYAAALQLVRRFLGSHWWDAPAYYQAGSLEAALGHSAAALAAWRETARLDVHDAEALSAGASLCLQEQRFAEARALEHAAVGRQPDSPKQRTLFAQVLTHTGEAPEAARQLAIARALAGSVASP